eukprot:9480524-Prorocentrum_lima.AAC.1
MLGSAAAWAQGRIPDNDAAKLFAWRFARTCPQGSSLSRSLLLLSPARGCMCFPASILSGSTPQCCALSRLSILAVLHRGDGGRDPHATGRVGQLCRSELPRARHHGRRGPRRERRVAHDRVRHRLGADGALIF